jgi:hypothetical protein
MTTTRNFSGDPGGVGVGFKFFFEHLGVFVVGWFDERGGASDRLASLVRRYRSPRRDVLAAAMPNGFQHAEQQRLQRRPTQ